ncbi:MAG: 4Fe-4S ferredoxin [Deltaproteobacteria bacterium]|nr:4Fe-4S ferredoxin [Deltaproteobacteria bacterium]
MAKRKIIQINQDLCNGCGQCLGGCAEAALELRDGKAHLVGEVFCDGLGACLGFCPTGALKIVEREAPEFSEEAVEERLARQKTGGAPPASEAAALPSAGGACCASAQEKVLIPPGPAAGGAAPADYQAASQLGHWPIKLQLLSPGAPFLQGADLVLLADCAAAALPDLHARVLPGRAVALACPKLDDVERHIAKLAELLAGCQPRSLSVVHMEVPCCRGLEYIARQALERSGLDLPLGGMVVGREGNILATHNLAWEHAA